jgi:hypothetical protein
MHTSSKPQLQSHVSLLPNRETKPKHLTKSNRKLKKKEERKLQCWRRGLEILWNLSKAVSPDWKTHTRKPTNPTKKNLVLLDRIPEVCKTSHPVNNSKRAPTKGVSHTNSQIHRENKKK